MTVVDLLSSLHCEALNNELAAIGCEWRVGTARAAGERRIILLASDGTELGDLPDRVDAPTIAAFERISRYGL